MVRAYNAVIGLILIAALTVAGCCCCAGGNRAPQATTTPTSGPTQIPHDGYAAPGGRLLGIAATPSSDNDFGKSFSMAKEAGLGVAEIPIRWDELEPAKGKFADANNDLKNGNTFYPAHGVYVAVTLACIDTNNDRRPADLRNLPFDDPAVIGRYDDAVDYVLSRLPDAQIICFSIGNEVDVYLGNDDIKWQQYENFYDQVAEHIRSVKPGLKIGVKTTLGGTNYNNVARIKNLNEDSDIILVTYYPLDDDFSVKAPSVAESDFDVICLNYSGKEIYFLEAGYPSSPIENSSEEQQARFVRELFVAWDKHQDQVKVVILLWLHDISPSMVNDLTQYYGLHDQKFAAYLGTLGLRTYDGKDKQGWAALKEESYARGF